MEDLKNKDFIKNPNLKLKEVIKEMDCCFGINDIFDVYYNRKENNELYLISADKNYTISIIRIRDKKLVKSLPCTQNKEIKMIRHFYNNKYNKDFLISSCKGSEIKIWDLSNNYNLIHSLKIDYSQNSIIFSGLLYFSENNGDYIITCSNCNENNDFTKIYNFNDGNFIENLENTNRFDIYYLLLWNRDENNDYLIQCSLGTIFIHNLQNKKLFQILRKENKSTIHNSACLIKNDGTDYLYVVNVNGLIDVWNLNTFQLKQSIEYFKSYFYHIISWNKRYILVAEKSNSSILVIDTMYNRVISVFKEIHKSFVNSLKKIDHPIYGESLLSCDFDNKILLWTHS